MPDEVKKEEEKKEALKEEAKEAFGGGGGFPFAQTALQTTCQSLANVGPSTRYCCMIREGFSLGRAPSSRRANRWCGVAATAPVASDQYIGFWDIIYYSYNKEPPK